MNFLGLSFDLKKYKHSVIKMMYSSMHDFGVPFIEKELRNGVKIYGGRFKVGVGVIAQGVANEKLMTPSLLDRDLKLCKKHGVKEVVIFRLGGLNKKYLKVIKRYI